MSADQIAVVGAGAVGCYFGATLALAGEEFTLFARPQQAAALSAHGLDFESIAATPAPAAGASSLPSRRRVPVRATADHSRLRDAGLILLCVKSYDTQEAAQQMAPYVSDGATVLCLQNGVEGYRIFQANTGRGAIPSVVYVAAQMKSPTHLLHKAAGNLVIGVPRGSKSSERSTDTDHPQLAAIAARLERGGVPTKVSAFIERDLWQ